MSKSPKNSNDLFSDALKAKDDEDVKAQTEATTEADDAADESAVGQAGDVTSEAPAEEPAAAAPAEPEIPEEPEILQLSELEMLMNRARMLGIAFTPDIGVDALKTKIQNRIDGVVEAPATPAPAQVLAADPGAPRALSPAEEMMVKRKEIRDENMRLVRVRITNLDPKKKDLPGEIFTVANRYLGTVRKYIPYGEATDNGYHIPFVLYKALKRRQFLQIKTRKGRGGTPIVDQQYVREFALEILPQLTPKELADLKAQQMSRGRDD